MGKGYRQNRLSEEIRKLISEMLFRELKDPRLTEHMISITAVSVTRDGNYATCYVSVYNNKSLFHRKSPKSQYSFFESRKTEKQHYLCYTVLLYIKCERN